MSGQLAASLRAWIPGVGSRSRAAGILVGLALGLVTSFLFAAGQGAYGLGWTDLLRLLFGQLADTPEGEAAALIFHSIRLPRLLLAAAAGAALAVCGAVMQGLFRNSLADPGLIGVSSGAALAAGVTIVLGALCWPELPRALGSWALVSTAFLGGLAVTGLIYRLAQGEGGTRVGHMLLAGIAINALAGAGLGLLSYLATDEQLRNLQFWLMGSLGGARWSAVLLVMGLSGISVAAALRLARPLNALALGEAQAVLLGVAVERLKRQAVVIAALGVGAVTATTGVIGFVGLVAPHMVRLLCGPDHRWVLPGSALLGASLVLLADALARTVAAPAELPLGVITALVGVPFFLALLRGRAGRLL